MAAKRYLEEYHHHGDEQPTEKRARKTTTLSLSSVIERVLVLKNMQIVADAIEPMLRRVVCEEIEEGLRRRSIKLTKSPSLRLHSSSLRLAFSTTLSLPIFTDTKISTADASPLRILLLDNSSNPTALSLRIKLQLVVLDGDFPKGDRDMWTAEEFNRKIVKERSGKRPLLAGEVNNISMRDGVVAVGDLEFTDNSSWIRSRRFRIGVRVAPGSNCGGMKIAEAFTDAFVVKDHRGEQYKKHHPPMLEDKVWRLEKIGKGGQFDTRLASKGISTVQDFLKLYVKSPTELRKILVNMSDKIWNVTINHAEKCVLGNKQYIFHTPSCSITFNPILQIMNAEIDGKFYHASELLGQNKAYVESLAKIAYKNWDSLEVVESGLVNSGSLMLTQGFGHHLADDDSPTSGHQTAAMRVTQYPEQQLDVADNAPFEMGSRTLFLGNNPQMATTSADWFDSEPLNENLNSSWADEELTYQMVTRGVMRADSSETYLYDNLQ